MDDNFRKKRLDSERRVLTIFYILKKASYLYYVILSFFIIIMKPMIQ